MMRWTNRFHDRPPRLETLEDRLAPGDSLLGTSLTAAWWDIGLALASQADGSESRAPATPRESLSPSPASTSAAVVLSSTASAVGERPAQSSQAIGALTTQSVPDRSTLRSLAAAEQALLAGPLTEDCCCCGTSDSTTGCCSGDPAADPALGLSLSALWSTGLETAHAPPMLRGAVHAGARDHGDFLPPLRDQYGPAVTSWQINQTGATGHSPDPTINAIVSQILADVQHVYFNDTDVYMQATGIPSYDIGPFPGNPNTPAEQDYTFRIPRAPQQGSGTFATPLGPIGVLVNGVVIFNALDGHSYQNQNVWHQNANIVEAPSFDSALGHPEMHGIYHHHQQPVSLRQQLGDDGSQHSPILGFAFDGFPIYGPYGYANPDGTGGIIRMTSSYQLRNITLRSTLPDGTLLPRSEWGPPVSTQYPLGYYAEDYAYVPGSGTLDAFNGRFTVTPDYPEGTFAYFATIDDQGQGVYPYLLGPDYYGDVATDDLNHSVQIPDDVTEYIP